MFNSQSYGKWQAMLKQLIRDNCQSRLSNLVLLVVGIFESKSVYLSLLARKTPVRAKKLSFSESTKVDCVLTKGLNLTKVKVTKP